MACKDLTE